MSAIKEKMAQDLKEAMKSGDTFKRDTLRLLNSALKQVEVDKRIILSDDDVISILKSAYKQREDALQSYVQAKRDDLAQKEKGEMDIILSYLPKQLSDEELREAVKSLIIEIGAEGVKDLGKVMGAAKKLSAVADGRRISTMARDLLS
ncbi:GatB/YqeY domain-containing protein [Helicobacter cholecystus]|uniref:GatB/YqeY domain-containing protein n=1 Tax=Helicobacter cholecystus TaxID=45498 RepID=A0A3D8IXH1_9HELI|nr:GatB/YqeY domain-containing protein [Helicobacter cholecystus]RDU69666.1 GatB/YqeY domain-containing protein [Helicobacter cholecystus]VEJ24229.1 GatB/Yqey family protein [Helicobacter cholecystus]